LTGRSIQSILRRQKISVHEQKTNMSAPIPKNEATRIKVLWQYDVLDTVPE
jgi:hypothetical protein